MLRAMCQEAELAIVPGMLGYVMAIKNVSLL